MRYAEINGAKQILKDLSASKDISKALRAASKTNAKSFRTALEKDWRDTSKGWTDKEFKFTPIQPRRGGRPRAIDFYNRNGPVGIELELSNQNAVSHDLLKLETAFHNGYICCGVLVVPTEETRMTGRWSRYGFYATYEYAKEWLRIYTPSLRSPIVVLGV